MANSSAVIPTLMLADSTRKGYTIAAAMKSTKVPPLPKRSKARRNGAVQPDYERVERRAPSYLAERKAEMPDGVHPATLGEAVAIQGPNCYQCHFHDGEDPDQVGTPIAWAPDLAISRERLREDWTRDWLWGPNLVYPGTSMPANFLGDPPEYQAVYPDSTNAQQIVCK